MAVWMARRTSGTPVKYRFNPPKITNATRVTAMLMLKGAAGRHDVRKPEQRGERAHANEKARDQTDRSATTDRTCQLLGIGVADTQD